MLSYSSNKSLTHWQINPDSRTWLNKYRSVMMHSVHFCQFLHVPILQYEPVCETIVYTLPIQKWSATLFCETIVYTLHIQKWSATLNVVIGTVLMMCLQAYVRFFNQRLDDSHQQPLQTRTSKGSKHSEPLLPVTIVVAQDRTSTTTTSQSLSSWSTCNQVCFWVLIVQIKFCILHYGLLLRCRMVMEL